ncbi:hypothetical protein [Massilia luteola]|uniref:hypothetical protein n=1 Tax=Massilia luteola TaxID=3081751 RepID=UPI002ACC0BD7|nr:hypothetical protein [Massilia sp. Gc5]
MDTRKTTDRDPQFDVLRAEVGRLDTPRAVEHALLQAFARQHPSRHRWYHGLTRRGWTLAGGLAGLAAGALALAFALQAPDVAGGRAGTLVARDDSGLFIALDSAERIAAEPAPRMVAADVPRASLAALGVPLTPENAGDSVRAEMLVAADGQPLALRLSAIE